MTIMFSRFLCHVVPFNFYEVLADYWQAMTLADAAAKCWYKLPIVHQLEAGYPWLSILRGMLVLWFLAGRNAPIFCWLIEIGYFFVYLQEC